MRRSAGDRRASHRGATEKRGLPLAVYFLSALPDPQLCYQTSATSHSLSRDDRTARDSRLTVHVGAEMTGASW